MLRASCAPRHALSACSSTLFWTLESVLFGQWHWAPLPLVTCWVWSVGGTSWRLEGARTEAEHLFPPPLLLCQLQGVMLDQGDDSFRMPSLWATASCGPNTLLPISSGPACDSTQVLWTLGDWIVLCQFSLCSLLPFVNSWFFMPIQPPILNKMLFFAGFLTKYTFINSFSLYLNSHINRNYNHCLQVRRLKLKISNNLRTHSGKSWHIDLGKGHDLEHCFLSLGAAGFCTLLQY